MKVVFFITELDYSGGPKMLAWVANQFAKNGNEVTIISIYSNEYSQKLEANIRFLSLNVKKSKNRFARNTTNMAKVLYRMQNAVTNENPDLIISFLYSPDIFYLILNKLSKRKMLVSIRLDPFSDKGFAALVRYRIIRLADGFVFQTEGAQNFFDKKIKEKSVIIPNPVPKIIKELSSSADIYEKRENVIILPARLNIKQKRQDLIIDAFCEILKKHREMRLILLGSGPDEHLIKSMIEKRNMAHYIQVHQAIQDQKEYLNFIKKAKIIALTSDYEGVPNSLIEAMGMGLVVVSTDCSPGGARLLIENHKNGILVERNNPKVLSNVICEILDCPNKAATLGEEAKKICDIFSEEKIALKWIDYSNKIISL